ncbi:MAG TPA: glycosyl hydrolase [Sphingomicrobium sp.]|nr:glycosyl hydrolase [Sphingomicrobium sp.]
MQSPSSFALALLACTALIPAHSSAAVKAPPAAGRVKPLEGLKYRLVGPFRGGRATGVTGVPGDPDTFYFGAASGGLWKTTDGGLTWKPLWDKFPEASPAVGAIAVAPSNPNILYVGTGETNIRGNVVTGNGLYKSTDAGKTWSFAGLRDTQVIGRIIVDPKDPNRLFAAALGHPFGPNSERGIFRSTDGGKTWAKVLYVDDKTGGVDVAFQPGNPRVMYAGMWQAYRKPWIMESGGPGSGFYKSVDGGSTWTRLTGNGLPEGILGRVNVAPTVDPNRIYAMIEAKKGGLYRTDDGGKTWKLINDKNQYRQRAWYFNTVFADPKKPDTVYVLNTALYRSTDAGKTFKNLHTPHGDDHELWIDPTDPKRMINGNDGGATITVNGGETWSSEMNQPTAQFYHIATDNQFPYRLYGDQQDNSSVSIASAGRDGGVGIEDYYEVGGGESGYIVPDPADPNIVYAGGYDAEITRYDHRTGMTRQITPWPRNSMGWAPANLEHRFQWTAPIMVSRHDPHALYFGAEMLFKSTDQGASWTAISPDLTRNDKTKQLSSGGPLTKDNTSVEIYDTIFSIADGVDANEIWVGTDDGLIQLTRDGGAHWTNITPPQMPEWATVDQVEVDPARPGTAYVAADRHRLDDFKPYAFKTANYGRTWAPITTGIPADAYVHVVRVDPARKGLLYAGTEKGVFASYDDGADWQPLQFNLPVTPVHDLAVKGDTLAVATHGRAFWVLDDLAPVRQWSDAVQASKAYLFAPQVASHTSFPTRTRGLRHFGGANPPAGAVIDYWLSPAFGTPRQNEDEKKDDAAKKDKAPDPLASRIKLEILDARGNLIRTIPEAKPEEQGQPKAARPRPNAPAKAVPGEQEQAAAEEEEEDEGPPKPKLTHYVGLNTFVWDMRYPSATAIPHSPLWAGSVEGPRALPGSYQVRLTVDGKSQTRPLVIAPDPRGIATPEALRAQFELHRQINAELDAIDKAVLDIRATRTRIAALKAAKPALAGRADDAIARMTAIEEVLVQPQAHASEDALNYPIQLNNMIAALGSLVDDGDYAPTVQDSQEFVALKAEADRQLAAWAALKAGMLKTLEQGRR